MQELNGYIKLYRKLIQWGWYQDSVVKDLFLHCLLTASFKEFKWMGQAMNAGQFVTSYKLLAEALGFTVQQIRTALKKLESTGEITSKSTNKYTVITVINWGSYQADDIDSNTQINKQITNKQQTKNAFFCKQIMNTVENLKKSTQSATNKKELESLLNSGIAEIENALSTQSATNEQQTSNKQITNKQQHRKNVKNVKNVKKSVCDGAGAAPHLSEIILFISENGLRVDGEKFYKRYSENGWKTESGKQITDWKSMLKVWDRREGEKKPVYANGYAGVKNLTDD
nr:MAG TPA: replisome organizer [Caudoviricetes sp.]